MGEWCGARLRRDCDHLCDPRPRASSDALRRERDEDRVRSGVGASGERPHRRSAGSDRSSGVRRARCGDAAILRSADVLASGSSRPCGVDAARVRDHRLDAARGPGSVHERGRAARISAYRRCKEPGSARSQRPRGVGLAPITETGASSPPASARSPESAGGFTPTPPSSPQSTCSRSSSAAASCHGDGWLMLRERRQAVGSFQSARTQPRTPE